MATYDERLASFAPRKSSKSSKKPQSTVGASWPHPDSYRATPETLAQAGFRFLPTDEKPDNVVCFTCGHGLGFWEPEDDPFSEHLSHSPKCVWAIARCSIELDKVGKSADGYVHAMNAELFLFLILFQVQSSRLQPRRDYPPRRRWRKLEPKPSREFGFTIKLKVIRPILKR